MELSNVPWPVTYGLAIMKKEAFGKWDLVFEKKVSGLARGNNKCSSLKKFHINGISFECMICYAEKELVVECIVD